jgi:hypothetical protein
MPFSGTLHSVALTTIEVSEERSACRLSVTANVVPSSSISVTLMMGAPRSSETSVLTRVTQRNMPADCILHSHCRENLKSDIALTGWALKRRSNASPVR